MPNGDWLCVYREATTHLVVTGADRGRIYGKTSSDEGGTWSTAATIVDDTSGQDDARDPTLLTLANGTIVMPYTLTPPTVSRVAVSDDNAASWTTGIVLTNTFTDYAFSSGVPVELDNGDVLQAYYGEDIGDSFSSVRVSASSDSGASWSHLAEIADGQGDGRSYQEPSLVKVGDGDIVCFMRTSDNVFYESRSSDDGATWSAPTSTGISGASRPAVFRNAAGTLTFIYRNSASGAGARIQFSDDDGATWMTRAVWDPTSISPTRQFAYYQMIEPSTGELAVAWAYDYVGGDPAQGSVVLERLLA